MVHVSGNRDRFFFRSHRAGANNRTVPVGPTDPILPLLQQAQTLLAQGNPSQAAQVLHTALRRAPRDLRVVTLMGQAFMLGGELDRAEFFAAQAVQLAPGNAGLLTNHALTLLNASAGRPAKLAAARAALDKAIALDPAAADAQVLRVQMVIEQGRAVEGLALARAAQGQVEDPELVMYESLALSVLGRSDEALGVVDRALARWPDHPGLCLAACLPAHAAVLPTPEDVFARHQRYGRVLCGAVAPMGVAAPPLASDGPLRVGVMSPDLRRHSVASFVGAIFEHAPGLGVELHVYATGPEHDEVSDRLARGARAWHRLGHATDEVIAQRIAADGLHVLVDLAGLTSGGRPRVLAMKPAPRIVTYCGYPDTTGLPTVDARLVDARTDPPGAERLAVERLVRLEGCFLCYSPPVDGPASRPPAQEAGAVTFASFNAVRKLNEPTLRRWRAVLDGVKGSRLLLKWGDVRDDGVREHVRAELARVGLADRTELIDKTPGWREHLLLYHRVDVALDTFPYHGTTTTCEALWMGVPVVTMSGRTHASRVGISLLHAVGLEDLVAGDEAQFVAQAVALGNDAPRRASLHAALRERMSGSVLCDGPGFARRWVAALRSVVVGGLDPR